MNTSYNIIDEQIKYNSGINLFYDSNLRASETLLKSLNILKRKSDLDIENLLKETLDKVLQEFCRINQYYNFSKQSIDELKKIYIKLHIQIKESSEDSIALILKDHGHNLKLWLLQNNSFAGQIYESGDQFLQPVTCEEYATEMQIYLLRLDFTQNLIPVLDIGCGKKNLLVDFLRKKGVNAYGIDRFKNENSYIANVNWLEFDYGVNQWGTIVSNLGFSNHFIHQHLREDGNFELYARKYMEILNSLKINGQFHYAPDLPFIEKYLDKTYYSIRKFDITEEYKTTIIKRLK